MDSKFFESGQVSFTNIKTGTKTGFKKFTPQMKLTGLMKYVADIVLKWTAISETAK